MFFKKIILGCFLHVGTCRMICGSSSKKQFCSVKKMKEVFGKMKKICIFKRVKTNVYGSFISNTV